MYEYSIVYTTESGTIKSKRGKMYHADVEQVLDQQTDMIQANWMEITIFDSCEGDIHSQYERDGADIYEYTCTYRCI